MISKRTSCLVRSRWPRCVTRSSSATWLHEVAARILLLLDSCVIEEYGVPERNDGVDASAIFFCMYGDTVRVDAALTAVVGVD